MNEPVIVLNRLSKSFGDVHAVQDLSLTIVPGTIFGLNAVVAELGQQPTGSFKTWLCWGVVKAVAENSALTKIISATTGNQGIALSYVVNELRAVTGPVRQGVEEKFVPIRHFNFARKLTCDW